MALDDVSLRIGQGEFVAIVGPSGGGKSTLLNVLGLLDFPDGGEYLIDGAAMPSQEGATTARIRSTAFAFVFQAFHLLLSRPVRHSVELGLMYRGVKARAEPATAALERVGLAGRAEEIASHLSGGQQQRAAIARAIASNARIVLADEPTGNLDSENARLIIAELQALNKAGATVIVVTHSADVAAAADRQLRIRDGRLVSDTVQEHPDGVASVRATEEPRDRAETPMHSAAIPARTPADTRLQTAAGDQDWTHPTRWKKRPSLLKRDIFRDAWQSAL
ncbi:ABC transporter ATP-binding protein, partial [Microbacterium sp. MYb62]|uniref:ABC transporter ATP-binding protein n=1 Tax=Microbacterium sp. MYb62 TaxID=1848690 RepID=UPI002157329A